MKRSIILLISFIIVFYLALGVYVIPPIGAVPEGASVLYFRLGFNLNAIDSADGVIFRKNKGGDVNLLVRGIALGVTAKHIAGREILVLPYSEYLYIISTDGDSRFIR